MVVTYAVPINPRSSTSAVLRHCSQQHISAGTGFTLSEIEGELRDRPEGFADDDDASREVPEQSDQYMWRHNVPTHVHHHTLM
jgi:hypothetical protein